MWFQNLCVCVVIRLLVQGGHNQILSAGDDYCVKRWDIRHPALFGTCREILPEIRRNYFRIMLIPGCIFFYAAFLAVYRSASAGGCQEST